MMNEEEMVAHVMKKSGVTKHEADMLLIMAGIAYTAALTKDVSTPLPSRKVLSSVLATHATDIVAKLADEALVKRGVGGGMHYVSSHLLKGVDVAVEMYKVEVENYHAERVASSAGMDEKAKAAMKEALSKFTK